MPNVTSYGFIGLKHVFDQRVDQVGVEEVHTAITATLAEHNRMLDELISSLVVRTVEYKENYKLPGSGSLQPLDEWGVPLPVAPSGEYDVAYPIQRAGTAWGTNRESRAMMTVDDVNRLTWDATMRDIDWMRRHILAAIFTNTNWTYKDDRWGNLIITPLANGDATVYLRRGGANTIDNHYLAQAAAIDNSNNPFDDIYDELTEHPSNTGDVVAYIPTNLKTAVTGLAAFIPIRDPDVMYGDNVDTIRDAAAENARGFGGAMLGFGDKVLGKVNEVWIVEWKSLPNNYILGTMTGVTDVVAMREFPNEALQGFFPEFMDVNGNVKQNSFIRICGFGIANRVGAVVYMIGGGAYVIPTGYTAPLAS